MWRSQNIRSLTRIRLPYSFIKNKNRKRIVLLNKWRPFLLLFIYLFTLTGMHIRIYITLSFLKFIKCMIQLSSRYKNNKIIILNGTDFHFTVCIMHTHIKHLLTYMCKCNKRVSLFLIIQSFYTIQIMIVVHINLFDALG